MTDTLGYVRVSKEEQAREDRTSLADQRTRITALASALGRTLGQVFEDAGVSGGTAEGRPAFMALVAYCRDHARPAKDGLVLVYNDSRWGRFDDPEESTYWRVALRRSGWVVRFAENDATEDPTARGVLRAIGSASASLERQAIKQRSRQGARGTAAQGYWQNKAPIGYRRQAIDLDGSTRIMEAGKRKGDSERARLVPGPPEEVALIRWVFDTYATGTVSMGMLAAQALTRWPGKKWSRGVLKTLLRNPAYVGDVVWCRRPADAEERHRQRIRPRGEWVIARNAHPAIVDRDVFDQVQALLARQPTQQRAATGSYVLSALMRCAHCGELYVGGGGAAGPPEDPQRWKIYRHRALSHYQDRPDKVRPCPYLMATIAKQTIERTVVAALGEVLQRPAVAGAIERAVDQALAAEQRAARTREPDLQRRRRQLEGQRDRLLDLAARGVLSDEDIRSRLEALRVALDQVAMDEVASHRIGKRLDALEARRTALRTAAKDFPTLAANVRGAALRALLVPWIQDAVVDRSVNELRVTIAPVVTPNPTGGLRGPGSP